eukprot:5665367-Amphidinium_carterae.1
MPPVALSTNGGKQSVARRGMPFCESYVGVWAPVVRRDARVAVIANNTTPLAAIHCAQASKKTTLNQQAAMLRAPNSS